MSWIRFGYLLMRTFLLAVGLLVFQSVLAFPEQGTYHLVVEDLPANTPANDTLYVAGNFNNWVSKESRYQLIQQPDGTYQVTITTHLDTLEYKYNRGTWPSVEGDLFGQVRSNHVAIQNGLRNLTVRDQIQSWEDLQSNDTYTFVIEGVPNNTPIDATLYITGDFNNWNPGDPNYRFTKLPDGRYTYTMRGGSETLHYKFTRGTWDTVEGGPDGKAIGNRTFTRSKGGAEVLFATIKTWEDFSGAKINYYDFILIISSVIAFLLLIVFNWMANANLQANRFLSLALSVIIITSVARILTNYRDIFNLEPRLVLVPDLIYFSFAPLVYFYFQSLLGVRPRVSHSKWLSFIPAGILILSYLPLLTHEPEVFIDKTVNRAFHSWFAIAGGFGFMYNLFYWLRSLRVLHIYTAKKDNTLSFDQSHYYLNSLLTLFAACLFTWMATYIIGGIGWLWELDTIRTTDTTSDLTWILLSGTPFLVAYFAMSQPELFRTTEVFEKYRFSNLNDESAATLKTQLTRLMDTEKPFLNPKLTLLELAEMMETNTHTLSRVINESLNRNFYDFVNYYRVEEFKTRVNQEDCRNLTFLAIAHQVGFSSKTTFNRAFKKLEGLTPREFHKKLVSEGASDEMKWV